MSWDIFISRTPVDQLSEANFESLGSKKEVIHKLSELLPSANFADSEWGTYKDDECSIEFNMNNDNDELKHLTFHIRGGGERPLCILKEICDTSECYAMDGSSGEQMNFDKQTEKSFKEWQNYRDTVLNR